MLKTFTGVYILMSLVLKKVWIQVQTGLAIESLKNKGRKRKEKKILK